jgi:hypothetical protein
MVEKADMKKLILLFLVSACNSNDKQAPASTEHGPWEKYQKDAQESHVGRFQYIPQSGGYINRGKLIDTATGRIWQDTCFVKGKGSECESSAWTEETVIGVTTTYEDHINFLNAAYPNRFKK